MKDSAFSKDLFIPFYCGNCGNLVFLRKTDDSSDALALDFMNSSWRRHPCKYFRGESLLESESERKSPDPERGAEERPFVFKKGRGSQGKQNKPTVGVIVSVPTEENNILTLITPENALIKLKTLFDASKTRVGTLVDLADMTRIGPGKYRLPELHQAVIPANFAVRSNIPDELYQLSVSSSDQERLEGFVNRLLKTLLKEGIYISMITMSAVDDSSPLHGRKIILHPAPDLIQKIENIVIPSSIEISVKQLKVKAFAQSAL